MTDLLDKAGSGSVDPEDFNAVVDAIESGPTGKVTAADIDSLAAQDGDVLTADGAGNATWEAGGGSQPGAVRVLKYDFDFTQVAALKTGVTVYTPTAGDVLLDAWIDCPVAWNTDGPNDPKADIGAIVTGAWDISGFFNNLYGKYNLTNASTQEGTDVAVGIGSAGAAGLALAAAQTMAVVAGSAAVVSQVRLRTTHPLSLVVSSDGTPAGDESDVTSGAATLYIVVSSPGDAS